MELKTITELLQQLVYSGATVQIWIDGKFATVLTVEEADGNIAVTTIHASSTSQTQTIVTPGVAFTVILPPVKEEVRHEEPHRD